MRTHGLTIDTQQIGAGIYAMIEAADQAHLVAFGMIPIEFVQPTEKLIRERFAREALKSPKTVADLVLHVMKTKGWSVEECAGLTLQAAQGDPDLVA